MRYIVALIFLSVTSLAKAQNLKLDGHWLLSSITSSPPEMTMGDNGAELNYGNEGGQTFIEPGLMLLSIFPDGSAKSFYADVEENWTLIQRDDRILFESKEDTLYGRLRHPTLTLDLRSTLEEGNSLYSFQQYKPEAINLQLDNTTWKLSTSSALLNEKIFEFKSNGELFIVQGETRTREEYFLHQLGNFYALEFTSSEMPAEFAIIYFEQANGSTMSGITLLGYISSEKMIPFTRHTVQFTKQ